MAINDDLRDQLAGYLDNGWSVVGYDTQMLAMGNITHFILLQNQYALKSFAFVMDRGKTLGSTETNLAPSGVSA